MVRATSAAAAVTMAVGLGLCGAAANAGLDKLHKQRVEGGRVCFIDHWHYKASGAWPSKAEAQAAASKSWSRFTGAEYGPQWGDLRNAAEVGMECGSVAGHRGPTWSCNLKARPCRR